MQVMTWFYDWGKQSFFSPDTNSERNHDDGVTEATYPLSFYKVDLDFHPKNEHGCHTDLENDMLKCTHQVKFGCIPQQVEDQSLPGNKRYPSNLKQGGPDGKREWEWKWRCNVRACI